ncbi:CDP-alcohol phosphatidyltransferase family protein [Salinispira pacifica]
MSSGNKQLNHLVFSIIETVVLFFLFQIGLVTVVALLYKIPFERIFSFFPVAVAMHGLLLGLLLVRRQDFRIMDTGRELERINIPNVLSVFRISAAPSVLYLLILARDYPVSAVLISLVVLSFISDFLDGKLSRRLGEVTKIGNYLDSVSDYAILIVVSVAFNYFGLVHTWFFVLVLIRLGFQFLGMGTLLLYRGKVKTGSNFIGKASVFATMVVYAVALLGLITQFKQTVAVVLPILEYIGGAIVAVSLVEKSVTIGKEFLVALKEKREHSTEHPPHRS